MSSNTTLTDEQIGDRIQRGKDFSVGSSQERKAALAAAKYLGARIATRAHDGGFRIMFINKNKTTIRK